MTGPWARACKEVDVAKRPASKAQIGYMWIHHPKIAHKWAHSAKRRYGKRTWYRRLPRHSHK